VPQPARRARFEPTPDSVPAARRLVQPLVKNLPADVAECLELVVSELASNAVRHARTPYELTVEVFPTLRVEVTDANPSPPVRKNPGPMDEGGRGLLIVDACAKRWGVAPLPTGKVVWAELHSVAEEDGQH
jgi:anti-sigma regulatory factor (Ser/Thr protein kinase)